MSSSNSEPEIAVLLEIVEEQSYGEEPPMSEWSSLENPIDMVHEKRILHAQGLYTPGSGEICAKYAALSDSSIFRHPYYNYPAVHDPGIKAALLSPALPITYGDDGIDLYKALCKEMNSCPVGLFYNNLLNSEIILSYYGIASYGIRPMAIALQYNKYVQKLDLTDNFLNEDSCYHLGQMLNVNITLKELNLTGCRIGASGLYRLGDTLYLNKTLITLNLARNQLEEDGGQFFGQILARGAPMKRISLRKNGLSRMTVAALSDVFLYKGNITHLDLSMNQLHHVPSTVRLLNALSGSKILQELNLSYTGLEGERVAEALQHILTVPSLVTLNVSSNRLAGEPLEIFLSSLAKAKKLVTLDLSHNPLSPEDALMTLSQMLKPRVKVQNLFIADVWVDKRFPGVLHNVMKMKSRKNFVIEYAGILQNWDIEGPDARELIMKRADYLGNLSKKNKVDVALFFLTVCKENPLRSDRMPVQALIDRVDADEIPISEDLVKDLADVFPGPKSGKIKYVNLDLLCEYMQRLWPDRKLPPTPPPAPLQDPNPKSVPPPKKSKKRR